MKIGEDRTNQKRRFDSDLWNLDFNAGFPSHHPLFKYNDNHILVGYSRSFFGQDLCLPDSPSLEKFSGDT